MRVTTNLTAILLLANRVFSWNPAPTRYNVTSSDGTVVISLFPSGGPVGVAGPDFKPGADGKAMLVDYGLPRSFHSARPHSFSFPTARFQSWRPLWKRIRTSAMKRIRLLYTVYSHGCPHCWFFAVTFTKVARAIFGGEVETVAVNCGDEKMNPVCDKAGVYIYPTLLFYAGREGTKCNDKPCHWDGPHNSAHKVVSWITEQFGSDPVTNPTALQNGAHFAEKRRYVRPMDPPGRDGWESAQSFATTFDRWSDALRAFINALKRHYEPWLYDKTVDVVNFVVATIPGNRAALDELSEYIAKKSYESRTELAEMLDAWSNRWQLAPEFSSCKNPTCGLWILFHVSVAANAVDVKDTASVGRGASPEESLAFVNTMVTHFFGCEQCMRHFKIMYASPARQAVHSGKDAVLWLWRAHQRVNLRVTAEHNTYFDRRWPPYRQCPACWRSSIVTGSEKPRARVLATLFEHAKLVKREEAALTTQGRSVNGNVEHASWHELDVPFNIDNVYMLLLQTYIGFENIHQSKITL